MINKRLLIRNLLSHHDENSFYDKKRQLNLHSKEGKGKFLKHVCALSNSNPKNNSFLVVGIEDEENLIVGTDFYDDSKIQNLVNAFLENPPTIQYENVPFPDLPPNRVVGLVTVRPQKGLTSFKKAIYTIPVGTFFSRMGSNSVPDVWPKENGNRALVESIEKISRNNLNHILDSVVSFVTMAHKDMKADYCVFKEFFVVCWAGKPRKIRDKVFYSRVDIELINEQIKLFYSTFDAVTIDYNKDEFVITEYLHLGLKDATTYYPFERLVLHFYENGSYTMKNTLLFEPPKYNPKLLGHIYQANLKLLDKLERREPLTSSQERDLAQLPQTMMICYLNNFEAAKAVLIGAKDLLKQAENEAVYSSFKEVMRILRKVKYEVNEE
ncbi:ATP-binding protein [Flavobacterium sp. JP2137]|uniref:ATP-binding protein n=1 Tax=Flavobacterium sp. JP2137 TaxID=3414510 RepID=UPI003D30162B